MCQPRARAVLADAAVAVLVTPRNRALHPTSRPSQIILHESSVNLCNSKSSRSVHTCNSKSSVHRPTCNSKSKPCFYATTVENHEISVELRSGSQINLITESVADHFGFDGSV